MNYIVHHELILTKNQNAIEHWCNENFAEWWHYRDSLDTDFSRRTYFFRTEEDKFKFILRWL